MPGWQKVSGHGEKKLAFCRSLCYYSRALKSTQPISGCGADGSALEWGSRGRWFKSSHSDHVEGEAETLPLFACRIWTSGLLRRRRVRSRRRPADASRRPAAGSNPVTRTTWKGKRKRFPFLHAGFGPAASCAGGASDPAAGRRTHRVGRPLVQIQSLGPRRNRFHSVPASFFACGKKDAIHSVTSVPPLKTEPAALGFGFVFCCALTCFWPAVCPLGPKVT